MYVAVFALFLGTFSIGTTEFVISGILPMIAQDFGVSIPDAGLLVTAYAISVAVGGPILTLALARLTRKIAALALMALFIVGHAFTALAPDYWWALFGRVVTAMGHGGYFGVAVVLAASIAPKDRVGTVLSFIFAGVTIANIIGVPVGAALGGWFGWRVPIWVVAGMAAIGATAILFFVPSQNEEQAERASIARQVQALGNQQVMTSFAVIFLMMVAMWSTNTFIAPYLTDVVGAPPAWIPPILLLFGIFATLGIFIGGRLADKRPTETLRYAFPLLAVFYLLAYLFAPGQVWLGTVLIAMVVFPITLVATTVQNRVLIGAKAAPDLASTLISSVFNVGTATGSWIAATALTAGLAYTQLPLLSLIAAIATSALAFVITAPELRARRATGSA